MKLCFEVTIGGFDIKLYQTGKTFDVVYGRQISTSLSYERATDELGQCILHALACEGRLDNEDVV